MSKLSKIILAFLSFILVFSVVTNEPAKAADRIPTEEEATKAKEFTEKALTINPDGSFYIDKKEASKIYSNSEVKKIERTFKSIDKKTLAKLYTEFGSPQTEKQADVTPYFAPAIPIVAMSVWELLGWLGAIGAASVAGAFAKDMYTHGVKSACKKFASQNKHIKSWCTNNGYL